MLLTRHEGCTTGRHLTTGPFGFGGPLTTRLGPTAARLGENRLDFINTPTEYLVNVEAPGMLKADMKCTLDNGILTVSGDKKVEGEWAEGDYYRRERAQGSFSRQVNLPTDAAANLTCSYRDGVLHVKVPKVPAEQRTAKTIPIE